MTATLLLGGMNAQWQRDRMEDRLEQGQELQDWLGKRPNAWAQSIAMRAALRSLPFLNFAPDPWLKRYTFYALRPLLITWSAQNFPKLDWSNLAADIVNADQLEDAALESEKFESPVDYVVLAAVNAAQSLEVRFGPPSTEVNTVDTMSMADGAIEAAQKLGFELQMAPSDVWEQMIVDKRWLEDNIGKRSATRIFSRRSLWLGHVPRELGNIWYQLSARLLTIDPNYSVWIDWYERRIRGERAAFYIPGDKYRKEDKKILRRLAEASDEDFWGKGHEHVNATLKGWLDEARARVAPPLQETEIETPPQDSGAIAYGINEQGKLDRLPNSNQVHLRDVPDQRRAYDDLREAAAELLAEGQRLGHRLQRALDRFLHSLPGGFENAEAYLVWRDANALRRLHRAHREAATTPEPDEAKLEPVIAEGLGGLLDLYNNFAFADDGLRAKDEARISPQERASRQAEADAAKPIVNAMLAAKDIATPEALDDIAADAENAELPSGDPYAAQVLDQANRTKRNWIAGLLGGAREALSDPKLLGKEAVIGFAKGAGQAVGVIALTAAIYLDYAPLFEFIATNAAALQSYVAVAYTSFPHLPDLVARIVAMWNHMRNNGPN
jgi:hypothetical protein